jgi:hypothetical protein
VEQWLGVPKGEAESSTDFEQAFGWFKFRYAGLNTPGAGSIPRDVGGWLYLLPRLRTKRKAL